VNGNFNNELTGKIQQKTKKAFGQVSTLPLFM
jgi:hypothetical protein